MADPAMEAVYEEDMMPGTMKQWNKTQDIKQIPRKRMVCGGFRFQEIGLTYSATVAAATEVLCSTIRIVPSSLK